MTPATQTQAASTPTLAETILEFFNTSDLDAIQVKDRIGNDPNFGESSSGAGITISTAEAIVDARPPEGFTSLQQFDEVAGVGPITLHNILYSFRPDGSNLTIVNRSPTIELRSPSAGKIKDEDGRNDGWCQLLFSAADEKGGIPQLKWAMDYSARDDFLYLYDHTSGEVAMALHDKGDIVLTPSRNVVIGTQFRDDNKVMVPTSKLTGKGLHICSDDGDAMIKVEGKESANAYFTGVPAGNANMYVSNAGTGNLFLGVGKPVTNDVTITPDGNVGIGTTSPDILLDIEGSETMIQACNSTHKDHPVIQIGVGADGNSFIAANSKLGSPSLDLNFATRNAGAWNQVMTLKGNGKVGIGTTDPQEELEVAGTIKAEKVCIDNWEICVADYVFDDDYELMDLKELEKYVKDNRHLPDIPAGEEMLKDGVDLGELCMSLLKKVEELSLYVLSQNKRLGELEAMPIR